MVHAPINVAVLLCDEQQSEDVCFLGQALFVILGSFCFKALADLT